MSFYDPKTRQFTQIDTCFAAEQGDFGADGRIYFGADSVVGWVNTRVFDKATPAGQVSEQSVQGWCPIVLDTNGDGTISKGWTEPNQPVDSTKDKRVLVNIYAVSVSPADGSVWGTVVGYPGQIVRVQPGSNPTETAVSEIYEVPLPGFGPLGGDIDNNGVFWASLASGHLASFDRRKCKVLRGPTATGKHCPEGWSFYQLPGPQLKDVKDPGSAEASYYTWVDRFDTFGLGRNIPIAMGNLNDSIFALVNGKFVDFRIPYPSGFFPKNVDGRIDDPNAGWKGRGLWSTSGTRTMFHLEGGKQNQPKAARFQLRPDPLAR